MQQPHSLLFLGTGTSGTVPAIHCLTTNTTTNKSYPCKTCLSNDPKNKRGNTSVAIYNPNTDMDDGCIIIDCGKTFYQAACTYFPQHGLRKIKAVILTHGHADAVIGLDDLRAWTMGGKARAIQDSVQVFLSAECYEVVKRMFPYLVNPQMATGGGDVGQLTFTIIEPDQPFEIGSTIVIPLPVHHGFAGDSPYITLGFRVGNCSYISDCSHIPQSTTELIKGSEVLIIDGLKYLPHASHISIPQALTYSLNLQPAPTRVLLTDFQHSVEHNEMNAKLDAWQSIIQVNAPSQELGWTSEWWEHSQVWNMERVHEDQQRRRQDGDDKESGACIELFPTEQSKSKPVKVQTADQIRIPDFECAYDGQLVDITIESL